MLPLYHNAHRRTAADAITPHRHHRLAHPKSAFCIPLNPFPSPVGPFLIATPQNAEFRVTHRKQRVTTKSNRYFWTFFCQFVSSTPNRLCSRMIKSVKPAKFARFLAPVLCPIPGRMIPMTGQDGPTPPLQCSSKQHNINSLSQLQHRNSICDTYNEVGIRGHRSPRN
jgi:hypothetical protein